MNLHLLNFLTLSSLASANHKNMRGLMKKKKPNPKCKASIAVANRASGTLSILDTGSANNVKTIKMPGSNAEPVSYVYFRFLKKLRHSASIKDVRSGCKWVCVCRR